MSDSPPERFSVSIPPADELSTERIDELVEELDCSGRSELIRVLLKGVDEGEYDYPPENL